MCSNKDAFFPEEPVLMDLSRFMVQLRDYITNEAAGHGDFKQLSHISMAK